MAWGWAKTMNERNFFCFIFFLAKINQVRVEKDKPDTR